MIRRSPLVALLLSLCLMLGAVSEAVARGQMLGMSDLVLCSADGQVTVTLDTEGNPVQRHPCTHCLAASPLGVLVTPMAALPPARMVSQVVRPLPALRWLSASTLTPLARGPPEAL